MADDLRIVLSNAGPLIALGKLNRLALLAHLYPNLSVPKTAYREVVAEGTLGILVAAHRSDLLTFDELELLFLTIAARPDIWISEKLCRQILSELERPAGPPP